MSGVKFPAKRWSNDCDDGWGNRTCHRATTLAHRRPNGKNKSKAFFVWQKKKNRERKEKNKKKIFSFYVMEFFF